MVSFSTSWRVVCAVVALAGCSRGPAHADGNKATAAALAPFDRHYGVYLNGHKIGWMRAQRTVGTEVVMRTELHGRVKGMGQSSDVELREERVYSTATGRLERLAFDQVAEGSHVSVKGRRRDAVLVLDVSAGGRLQSQEIAASEGLEDALAAERLAAAAQVGSQATARHVDPSLQRVIEAHHRVVAVEKRMFGGVVTSAVQLETSYPDLGVQESSWMDAQGVVLESRIGGFFVARIEPPEEAQRLDYQQDLLVSAVVKAPAEIGDPGSLQRGELVLAGWSGELPPTTDRQAVSRQGDRVAVKLLRDPPVSAIALSRPGDPQPNAALRQHLDPTPFIQSDAPAIITAATQAIGDATDVATAIERLVHFVSGHVRDAYVPAYSNALDTLATGRGDCTEHSVLFVALARALKIPARVAVGIAYWPPGHGFGWHAWSEIYAGDRWTTVDPTWDQTIADVTHVKLAEGGPAEQARIVMLLGALRITEMRLQ